MKSMCKYWGLHISTNINCLSTFLGSFWAVWRGLFWCLKAKPRLLWFPRYWQFNKWYCSGYQLICLISWPLLIALRHFSRAFGSHWDCVNHWRIDRDIAKWSLWQKRNKEVKEPDLFSGSSPDKLWAFIFQCQIYFCACKREFLEDTKKIFFTISYLQGVVLDYFDPFINKAEAYQSFDFLKEWSAFIQKLSNLFGLCSPEDNNEDAIVTIVSITNGHLLICDWWFGYLKSSKKRS